MICNFRNCSQQSSRHSQNPANLEHCGGPKPPIPNTVLGEAVILGLDDPAHVLAVFGERLSGFKFPVKRENTGKFRRFGRQGAKRARFSVYKSVTYIQIPYAPEQGIFWS